MSFKKALENQQVRSMINTSAIRPLPGVSYDAFQQIQKPENAAYVEELVQAAIDSGRISTRPNIDGGRLVMGPKGPIEVIDASFANPKAYSSVKATTTETFAGASIPSTLELRVASDGCYLGGVANADVLGEGLLAELKNQKSFAGASASDDFAITHLRINVFLARDAADDPAVTPTSGVTAFAGELGELSKELVSTTHGLVMAGNRQIIDQLPAKAVWFELETPVYLRAAYIEDGLEFADAVRGGSITTLIDLGDWDILADDDSLQLCVHFGVKGYYTQAV